MTLSQSALIAAASNTKDGVVWRSGVISVLLIVNFVIVLSVPLAVRSTLPVNVNTVAMLTGCGLMCLADLIRVALGVPSEVNGGSRGYRATAVGTAIVLLMTQWCVLIVCNSDSSIQSSLAAVTGLGIAIVGAAIRGAAIRQLGRGFISRSAPENSAGLVTTGVYSRMRHPSEVGLILCVVGLIVSSQVWFAFVVAVPISIVLAQARILAEERRLIEVYADDYRRYCQRTNRWLPSIYLSFSEQ